MTFLCWKGRKKRHRFDLDAESEIGSLFLCGSRTSVEVLNVLLWLNGQASGIYPAELIVLIFHPPAVPE